MKAAIYALFGGCSNENPGFSSEKVAIEYGLGFLMSKPLSKKEREAIKQEMRLFRLKAKAPHFLNLV